MLVLCCHRSDQDVPYSDEFKFYITTKLPNPHYMPEVTRLHDLRSLGQFFEVLRCAVTY